MQAVVSRGASMWTCKIAKEPESQIKQQTTDLKLSSINVAITIPYSV